MDIDSIIILRPPVDVWRERRGLRGLPIKDRLADSKKYEESLERTLKDVQALANLNQRISWMVAESAHNADTEAHRIQKYLHSVL